MVEFSDLPARERKSKDLVFELLAKDSPMSISVLQRRLKERYRLKMTYQAVRKTVRHLQARRILTHSRSGYSIDKSWLLRAKRLIDNVLSRQQRRSGVAVDELSDRDFSSYMLNSLYELDNFWSQVLEYGVQRMQHAASKEILCVNNYSWWMLINLGQETSLYSSFVRRGCRTTVLIFQDLYINRWAAKIYRGIGVHANVRRRTGVPDNIDINILNDMIIQVTYPAQIVRKMRCLLTTCRNIDDLSAQQLARLAHAKTQIKMTVQKDASLAAGLRAYYEGL